MVDITPSIAKFCDQIGIHPKNDPFGDGNWTDVPFTPEDREIGDLISYFIGSLSADLDCRAETRRDGWNLSAWDQWTRVAQALRSHGLKLVDISE